MTKDTFKFFLYRLNKEYRAELFTRRTTNETDDDWLDRYFTELACSRFDLQKETRQAVYTWAIRQYQRLDADFSSFVLARSQQQRRSTIVTDDSLTTGDSVASPPPADTIIMLVFWPRHIVVVENRSGMTTGETWLRNFHAILDASKNQLEIPVAPRLEPIPLQGSLQHHLRTLDRVFRFRLRLKLPNPELSRWAERVYEEMLEGHLTEYLQEFVSPSGMNVSEGSKAHSSAALAEGGYKEGPVSIDGEKDGRPVSIEEGKSAISGKIDQIHSLIRGLETNATGTRLPRALDMIREEIHRLFPHEN
jgi:hypothetical protein